SLLENGRNILAVHAFNTSIGGADFGFNAQLFGYMNNVGVSAPRVVRAEPTPGVVYAFTNLTITFSEPINGLDAGDLLVNGVPASGVSSSAGGVFTFSFARPPYGPVSITWATNHGITDLEIPPNDFDPFQPGGQWSYTLVDPVPSVTITAPADNAVVLAPAN